LLRRRHPRRRHPFRAYPSGAVPNGRTTDEDKFPVVPVVGGGVGAAFLVAAALIARSALADRPPESARALRAHASARE